MAIPQLLVHDKNDNVGVVVVENLKADDKIFCVVTEDNSDFTLFARENIPIGHKVALADLEEGDTIVKYGEDIGRVTAPVAIGDHVHVHNLKTKRW
ncbi:MAG: flagellar biosynthesis protein FlgA [Desulfobulbaceae bacterium]|nr:flagellar biosynthesis protein FlgA [Desulfobulbaceae bacterium]